MLEQGVNVHLCCDALSMAGHVDRACGLQRAVRSGAYATTSESVLMELSRSDARASHAISTILKETKDPARSSRFRELLVARAHKVKADSASVL